MTIVKHELKLNFKSFIIWTAVIAMFLMMCVFMYPEMKGQMKDVSDMFSSMGAFTEAFGMDKLNFGTLIGFYAIECGNILGIGGAFFAAIISVNSLAKEEKEHTAEFLLTQPINRSQIITEKLISVIIQIIVLNVVCYVLSILSILLIKEEVPFKSMTLMHIAYLILQIEIAGILFAISSFITKGNLGIGLGIATLFYFLNIVSNIASSAEFLKYITPFGYTEGADIVSDGKLDLIKISIGLGITIIGIVIAYLNYTKKNIKN